MTTTFQVTNADDIEVKLTVTMTLRDWKRLDLQMNTASYPALQLSSDIRDLVRQAEKQFYPERKDDE